MKYVSTFTLLAIAIPASAVAQSDELDNELAQLERKFAQNLQPSELDDLSDNPQFCEHPPEGLAAITFEPFIRLQAAMGFSDLDNSGFEHGSHDPIHDGFNITGLSLGTDILYNEHFAAYAEGIFTWNHVDGWDSELEEAYAKFLNLPGDIDLKAGRMLAEVGIQNHLHSHAWDFVDAPLTNVRFLGEDGLITEGVELRWTLPTSWNNQLIFSYGNAVSHDHGGEHGGHHEEEGDDHDEEEDEHGHSEEMEGVLWNKDIFTARYEVSFWPSDTRRYVYGASYIHGENNEKQTNHLYGVDFSYTWLQNEDLGKMLNWYNEVMLRDVSTEEGSFEEWAFSSSVVWQFSPEWQAALRYDYLEGATEPEFPERHRLSPSLAKSFAIGSVNSLARIQYNYDHSEERGDDHSFWLQFGFEWGSGDSHVH